MARYSEKFALRESGDGRFTFAGEGAYEMRLDFLSDRLLRVTQAKPAADIANTYFICPRGTELPVRGRERLSTDGFTMCAPECEATEKGLLFKTDGFALALELQNFRLTYMTADGRELFSDRATQSRNFYGELGRELCHYTARRRDDAFFGLGDKAGSVNRAGGRFTFRCVDAMGYDAENSDPLYKHIPFYICKTENGCYGVFYDTAAKCALDFGCELDNYHGLYSSFTTEDDALCCYVFFGTMGEIVRAFSAFCGEQTFQPKRMLKYCASAMGYADADNAQEALLGFVEKCRAEDFECGGFYLSSGYTAVDGKRCVFEWNRSAIPTPRELTRRFAENKIDIIANIKPAFLLTHPQYEKIARRGLFLKYPDGTPALCQFWDGLGSYIDFTNPEGYAFWKESVRKALFEQGIYYTWNDNNEFEVWDESILADNFGHPTPAYLLRPTLSMLMLRASYEAQCERAPELRQMLSTRSGGAGIWRYAQTWSGDNTTAWKTLRGNHRMGIAMSLSGMYNFGHDIGGFAGELPSGELFLRWLQHGVFMPRFTIHSWKPDGRVNEPWMYPDCTDAVRELFRLRKRLAPYLYNALYRAHVDAEPVITPLFYHFPDRRDYDADEYMVGESMLVKNVFDEGVTSVSIDLPDECGWFENENYYRAGAHAELACGAMDAPVCFIREGSVIPVDTAKYGFGEEREDVELRVYPLLSGAFLARYFDDDGETYAYRDGMCADVRMHVTCDAKSVAVECENLGKMGERPRFRLVDMVKPARTLVVTWKQDD